MTNSNQKLQHLRQLIQIELEDCKNHLWPHVCEMASTPAGYQRIEKQIIRYALEEAMPIGSAIALIEQEFAHAQA